MDAAALAGDDRVRRLVEQYEHRLERRRAGFVAKAVSSLMSTRAKSLSPAATRAIASGDPLAILVATASPSEPNKPRLEASTKGAALRIDRTVEGKLDRDRLPGLVRGLALPRAETPKTQQANQASQKIAERNCLVYAHGGTER